MRSSRLFSRIGRRWCRWRCGKWACPADGHRDRGGLPGDFVQALENECVTFHDQPEQIVAFGPAEALVAADLFRKVRRARGRETDIAIAACAITHHARLWTLNSEDFKDIPNVMLV